MRHKRFLASATVIGAEPFWPRIHHVTMMDGLETPRVLMGILRAWLPDLLVIHPPNDYHPHQTTTSNFVMDGTFAARIGSPRCSSLNSRVDMVSYLKSTGMLLRLGTRKQECRTLIVASVTAISTAIRNSVRSGYPGGLG